MPLHPAPLPCDSSATRGVGRRPGEPPLLWESVGRLCLGRVRGRSRRYRSLNRDGDVVLHVPKSHTVSVIEQQRAGWLRARVLKPEVDQPTYSASPTIKA